MGPVDDDVRISELVTRHGEIEEMDLNPVIVHEKGLTVVDARVVVDGTPHA